MRYLLFLIAFLSYNDSNCQITPSTEVFVEVHEFSYFTSEPCAEQRYSSTLKLGITKRINLLSLTTCNPKDKKFKGQIYFQVIVEGKIYNVPTTGITFNISTEQLFQSFKNFSEEDKLMFSRKNKLANETYYFKINEEIERKKNEELKRIEEENRLKEEKRIKEEIELQYNIYLLDSINEMRCSNELIEFETSFQASVQRAKDVVRLGKNKGGILITRFEVLTSEYGSTDVGLGIYNCSSKRIKYATFKLQAMNPVGDKIGGIESVKGIGFIESKESGEWEFENVWFSDILESVKIVSINLIFEDGTSTTITDVASIRIDDEPNLNLEDIDLSFQYTLFGGIGLHVYDKKETMLGLVFYDANFVIGAVMGSKDELMIWIDELSASIEAVEKNEEVLLSTFRTKKNSKLIYIKDEDKIGYILLADAKKLLLKLKEL